MHIQKIDQKNRYTFIKYSTIINSEIKETRCSTKIAIRLWGPKNGKQNTYLACWWNFYYFTNSSCSICLPGWMRIRIWCDREVQNISRSIKTTSGATGSDGHDIHRSAKAGKLTMKLDRIRGLVKYKRELVSAALLAITVPFGVLTAAKVTGFFIALARADLQEDAGTALIFYVAVSCITIV